MQHPGSPQTITRELDWLAFQYLAGNLSTEAVSEFETRLARDQAAREAVARAVELTQAVALVEAAAPERVVPACREEGVAVSRHADLPVEKTRTTHWIVPVAWLSMAALALVVVGNQFARRVEPHLTLTLHDPPVVATDVAAFSSGELASAWVDTAEFFVTADFVEADLLDDAMEYEVGGDEIFETARVTAAEGDVERLQAPSWMKAGLAASLETRAAE